MEGGWRLGKGNKDGRKKGEKQGSVLEPKIEPFVPKKGYDPRDLRSWAKRTGFVSTFSGETERSVSGRRDLNEGRNNGHSGLGDLERGVLEKNESISPKIEIDPILGRTRKRGPEIEPVTGVGNARDGNGGLGFRDGIERDENGTRNRAVEANSGTNNALRIDGVNGNENGNVQSFGVNAAPVMEQKTGDGDLGSSVHPDGEDSGDGGWHPSPKMVIGLKDNPGYGWFLVSIFNFADILLTYYELLVLYPSICDLSPLRNKSLEQGKRAFRNNLYVY